MYITRTLSHRKASHSLWGELHTQILIMTAIVQLVLLSAVAMQAALAAPAGAYHGGGPFNNGAYFNGAYNNGAYNNGAYNNGAYNNGAYNNGAYNNGAYNPAYGGGAAFDPYPPQYNFDYRVAEPRTGDYKNHQESRNGDAVRGQYSVAEPDGSLLTVRYAADDAHGYTAQVTRSGAAGTVVQNFPGAGPLPVGAPGGYVAPVAAVAPVAPVVPIAPAVAAAAHGAGGYGGAHGAGFGGAPYRPFVASGYGGPGYFGGYGTSSTSFHGPHAAYSYTN